MPYDRDREGQATKDGPRHTASRNGWLVLVGVQVVLGLIALFSVQALSGAWVGAVGAILSVVGLTAAIGATIVKSWESGR